MFGRADVSGSDDEQAGSNALPGKQGTKLFWESFSLCHSSDNENDSQLKNFSVMRQSFGR